MTDISVRASSRFRLRLLRAYRKTAALLAGKGLARFHGRVRPLDYELYNLLHFLVRPKGITRIPCEAGEMYINADDPSLAPYLLGNVHERINTELFRRTVKPGMRVVDVGACWGYYTLLAARLVGPTGIVYALEPEPSNCQLLSTNITSNHYNNVVAVEKAVSNTCGRRELFLDSVSSARHSFSRDALLRGGEPTRVDTVTLDSFFEGTGNMHVDVIKTSAEGADGLALYGAAQTLAMNPDLRIFMDFWPYRLDKCGTPSKEVLRLLNRTGFDRFTLIDDVRMEGRHVTFDELLRFCDTMQLNPDGVSLLVERSR